MSFFNAQDGREQVKNQDSNLGSYSEAVMKFE